MTLSAILDFVLKWILPFGVAIASFLFLAEYLEERYLKSNLDIFWKKIVSWMLFIGGAALAVSFVVHTKAYGAVSNAMHLFGMRALAWPVMGKMILQMQIIHLWTQQMWSYWSLVYGRAFAFVYVIGAFVELFALKWRISFWRAFNTIWPAVVMFPRIFLYFFGYQTPLQDIILAGKLKAKIRENLNDSYEAAVQGYDERGKAFEDGAGGTAHTQTIKAVAGAMKRTKVTVKTTSNGQRTARILIRQSRETETDRMIEQTLKGFGERVSGDSIYFPSDPTYSTELKGFVFDSSVPFNAGDELGSYKAIFSNPFAPDNRVTAENGEGFIKTFWHDITGTFSYLAKLTPFAIYQRMTAGSDRRYFRDTSADKAKFKVQQNLDLSVIPTPKDPKTGNTIDEQRQLAMKRASDRTRDVATALNSFGLYGQFKDVKVGGNSAIYEFSLPPDAKLPNDFDKVQNQIGNLLRIKNVPIITLQAGLLTVSMNNGVNIPVSFVDMIKRRKKGAPCIVSGVIGVDAMGDPIYFELSDAVPHAAMFGATGRGKSVLIECMLYSVMSATDPKHLRIAYADGKGNTFGFMGADSSHPNPFTYAPPADASGDMNYARALIISMEKETRRRIALFKELEVAKLAEYNKKMKAQGKEDKVLPEILFIVDEFSAITQQDKNLKGSEIAKLSTVDRFEYIAKMARSVGIRMLLANQSARKELVPGKISANLPGRVSLGVSEPVESEIALPETGIKVHLISQPGEFYSTMKGPMNPEHGNGPYIPQSIMDKLNDGLIKKFGPCKYLMSREDVFKVAEIDDEENKPADAEQPTPERPVRSFGRGRELGGAGNAIEQRMAERRTGRATGGRPLKPHQARLVRPANLDVELLRHSPQRALQLDRKYWPWLKSISKEIFDDNPAINTMRDQDKRQMQTKIAKLNERIDKHLQTARLTMPPAGAEVHVETSTPPTPAEPPLGRTREHAGTERSILHGRDQGRM